MSNQKRDIEKSNTDDLLYDEMDNISENFSDADKVKKKIKKLQSELDKCKEDGKSYLDGWQRSKADYVNLKKRVEEDKLNFSKYATEEFIIGLLPTLDSFDQAFKNKESWESIDQNWRMGIEFIHSQLVNFLVSYNVTEINCLGKDFKPEIHHGIEIIDVDDKNNDGKILEVILKGYKIGEKIIRHPNVKVGRFKS